MAMNDWLQSAYPWIKSAHVIFVIFWMAGLFMLPRFLVYHQEAGLGSAEAERWIDREAKLRKIILTPAMVAVWILGLTLAQTIHAWSQPWFHGKLALVLILTAYHGWMVRYARQLAKGEQRLSGKALRLINEVPGLATIAIVLLVIVKPF